MRKFLAALFLALTIAPTVPAVAVCQQFEFPEPQEIDDGPDPEELPRERRTFNRPRRSWRNNPIVLGAVAVGLAVVLPFGVFKVVRQMRYMSQQSQRAKAP